MFFSDFPAAGFFRQLFIEQGYKLNIVNEKYFKVSAEFYNVSAEFYKI